MLTTLLLFAWLTPVVAMSTCYLVLVSGVRRQGQKTRRVLQRPPCGRAGRGQGVALPCSGHLDLLADCQSVVGARVAGSGGPKRAVGIDHGEFYVN